VRCNVAITGPPCSNCTIDGENCTIPEKSQKRCAFFATPPQLAFLMLTECATIDGLDSRTDRLGQTPREQTDESIDTDMATPVPAMFSEKLPLTETTITTMPLRQTWSSLAPGHQ
jgi:hypothetical protein